jgi:hypothetical protein
LRLVRSGMWLRRDQRRVASKGKCWPGCLRTAGPDCGRHLIEGGIWAIQVPFSIHGRKSTGETWARGPLRTLKSAGSNRQGGPWLMCRAARGAGAGRDGGFGATINWMGSCVPFIPVRNSIAPRHAAADFRESVPCRDASPPGLRFQ